MPERTVPGRGQEIGAITRDRRLARVGGNDAGQNAWRSVLVDG
jgi:hypothetical protein